MTNRLKPLKTAVNGVSLARGLARAERSVLRTRSRRGLDHRGKGLQSGLHGRGQTDQRKPGEYPNRARGPGALRGCGGTPGESLAEFLVASGRLRAARLLAERTTFGVHSVDHAAMIAAIERPAGRPASGGRPVPPGSPRLSAVDV